MIIEQQKASKKESENLSEMSSTYSYVQARIRNDKNIIREKEMELENLKTRVNDLQKDIDEKNCQINNLKEKIDRENSYRGSALLDLIPGHSIIGAFSEGNLMRAVPLYSQVRGLISIISQNKEEYENHLQNKTNELNNLNNSISNAQKEISSIKHNVTTLESEGQNYRRKIDNLDQKIKKLGDTITDIKNVKLSLENLLTRYSSLHFDVNLIEEMIEVDLLDNDTVKEFIEDIGKINISLKKISY